MSTEEPTQEPEGHPISEPVRHQSDDEGEFGDKDPDDSFDADD
jgi:hypothetical protein